MDIFNTEIWKKVNNDLEVSSFGRFRSDTKGVYEYDYKSSNGHLYVLLNTDTGTELFLAEELVAKAFLTAHKSLNGKMVYVKHKNGDLHNNFIGNLIWQEFKEMWVPLKYPKVREGMYEISNIGRVRNIFNGIILKQDNSFGYVCYGLAGVQRGTHSKVFAHCLVATHFVPGKSIEKNIVNHIKRDRSSCNCLYLEWVSQSENVMHGVITGATDSITTEDADMIRDMLLDPIYEGNPTKIFNALDHKMYPNIKLYTIKMIKQNKQCRRSNKYDLDKMVFEKCEKTGVGSSLTKDDVFFILDTLKEFDGDYYSVNKTFIRLKDKIPSLTRPIIYNIRNKKAFKSWINEYERGDCHHV